MIGVCASAGDHEVVAELFELFKTPWELHAEGRPYDVILVCGEAPSTVDARLVIWCGACELRGDAGWGVTVQERRTTTVLAFGEQHLPIYRGCVLFGESREPLLREVGSGTAAAARVEISHQTHIRLGYDLLQEVRHLLSEGQPAERSSVPALDMHISVLREAIRRSALPLVEVLAAPDRAPFLACLTHDVDHPAVRNHLLDHTAWGFLFRAVVGSVAGLLRGRRTLAQLVQNWLAAVRLPFVYLGWSRDFWRHLDRYAEMEAGVAATFFVIPYKDRPGRCRDGRAPHKRATRYDVEDIREEVGQLRRLGCEIGVHGLDAWLDPAEARREKDRVRGIAPSGEIGVRMHWLYFDTVSASCLEAAGFDYDSTVGYNETVGFRAGTLQAYRPLGVQHLLELPLGVMDTALFYPDRLNLSPQAARQQIADLVRTAERYGGALTFNWHDRSIAPERLWDDFYRSMLEDLRRRGAWLCGAGQAVRWFRKRRSVTMRQEWVDDRSQVTVSLPPQPDIGPPLRVRLHQAQPGGDPSTGTPAGSWQDFPLRPGEQVSIPV